MIPLARIGVGLMQGLALLVLLQASQRHLWPATDVLILTPLLVTFTFVPVIIVSGLGNMRPRTLAIWAAVATLLCLGLGFHDAFRTDATGIPLLPTYLTPSRALLLSLTVILFMLHALIMAAEADKRLMATYQTHVDVAWKLGVQLVLAMGFVSLLWGVLYLCGELFRLINIRVVADIIYGQRFAVPVMAVAFAAAIHVTDVQASIVQGARNLGLVLLSWMLPLMTVIVSAFLLTLLATGLEPLWNTRRAAVILLAAAAILVFLINTAHRDGRPETRPGLVLRIASAVAVVALLPIVLLAGYAVALRLQQYGWTPDRVIAAACVTVAACYGLGYLVALARSGLELRGLETTNLATALVIILAVIALRTPLADPARIAVADQIRRLDSGRTTPEAFDYGFLRFQAGSYGTAALAELAARKEGPQAATIADLAKRAQQTASRFGVLVNMTPITPEQRQRNIKIAYPAGGSLPESFLRHDWNATPQRGALPPCLVQAQTCEAIIADLDEDGRPEVLLTRLTDGMAAFAADADGRWSILAAYIPSAGCSGVREAVSAGQIEIVKPRFNEIIVGKQRLSIAQPTRCDAIRILP